MNAKKMQWTQFWYYFHCRSEANIYLKKDQLAKAEKLLSQCIRLYPKCEQAYRCLAEAQLYAGEFKKCINTAMNGLEVDHSWKHLSTLVIEAEYSMSSEVAQKQILVGKFR